MPSKCTLASERRRKRGLLRSQVTSSLVTRTLLLMSHSCWSQVLTCPTHVEVRESRQLDSVLEWFRTGTGQSKDERGNQRLGLSTKLPSLFVCPFCKSAMIVVRPCSLPLDMSVAATNHLGLLQCWLLHIASAAHSGGTPVPA
jgi:hypothetical protein